MSFTIISRALTTQVAEPIFKYCTNRFGRSNLKLEKEIQSNLSWKPTIQIKRTQYDLLAIEVSEILYPIIIKIVANDILKSCSETPISVYVATPLSSYTADAKQSIVRELKQHGIGLFTVDDSGHVSEQIQAIPLMHHISQKDFNDALGSIPAPIKTKLQKSFETYRINSYQGLQECAQMVESLVWSLATQSHKEGWITPAPAKGKPAADIIDSLYNSNEKLLQNQRAYLGHARSYMKSYRNPTSHPPKSHKEAAKLIKDCRHGFLESLRVVSELCITHKALGFRAKIYFP